MNDNINYSWGKSIQIFVEEKKTWTFSMVTPRQPDSGDSIGFFIFLTSHQRNFHIAILMHPFCSASLSACMNVILFYDYYLSISKAIHCVISLKPNKWWQIVQFV